MNDDTDNLYCDVCHVRVSMSVGDDGRVLLTCHCYESGELVVRLPQRWSL